MRAAHLARDEALIRRCSSVSMLTFALADPAECRRAWARFLLGLDGVRPSLDEIVAIFKTDD